VKLTAKFLAAFSLATLLLLAINTYARIGREVEHFDTDMRGDAVAFTAALAHTIATVTQVYGPSAGVSAVARVNARARQFHASWLTLAELAARPKELQLGPADLSQLRAGGAAFRERTGVDGGSGALVTYVAVPEQDSTDVRTVLAVAESLEARDKFVRETVNGTIWFAATLLLSSLVVAVTLGAWLIARPIRSVQEKLRRIGEGDLSGPLVLRGHDEIGRIADELNRTCEVLLDNRTRLEAEAAAHAAMLEQIRHADRLATVGRLAAGIAHEIGTPLAVVAGRAQMIARGEVEGAEATQNASIVVEQTKRISTIIRQLLDFARKRPPSKVEVDLLATARTVITLLKPLADKRGVRLVLDESDTEGKDWVDEGQFQQVLTNLVANAIQATSRDGRVTVGMRSERVKPPPDHGGVEQTYRCLYVEDTGHGMDAATAARVFEPFFTTKDVGEGTGLGLSVAHGIVREHGGFLTVRSEPGKGSTFSIYLAPNAEEASA